MFSPAMLAVVIIGVIVLALAAFMAWAVGRYSPIIVRIFEEKPVLLPQRGTVEPDGEDVRFTTRDGLELAGTYLRAATPVRSGVLLFCHEFLSDRWSYQSYVAELRQRGFDIFTFDFRNHGESQSEPGYEPIQWLTEHEVRDLQAALAYLRSRPDRDPAGVALFGVSRGGNAALCVAAQDPGIWGVMTDGAFPTRGTMLPYMHRWATIYIGTQSLWKRMPPWVFGSLVSFLGWVVLVQVERRRNLRFSNIERAVARLSPRPLLMIHGEKDTYIGPEIAQQLFAEAGQPKELWIVPDAKHNRCREADPAGYSLRVLSFVERFGPRRLQPAMVPEPAVTISRAKAVQSSLPPQAAEGEPSPAPLPGGVVSPASP